MLQNIRDNSQGWIAKTIIGVIVVLMALTGFDAIIRATHHENVAAKVNGDDISIPELQQAQEMQRRQLQQRLDLLTGREREVLGMVIDGKASKVIARELNISVKTVDVHRTKIKEKMGVSSIALLVREVLDLGVP